MITGGTIWFAWEIIEDYYESQKKKKEMEERLRMVEKKLEDHLEET